MAKTCSAWLELCDTSVFDDLSEDFFFQGQLRRSILIDLSDKNKENPNSSCTLRKETDLKQPKWKKKGIWGNGQLHRSILIVDLLCMSEEPKVSKIKNPVIKSEENRKEGNQSGTTEMKIQNIRKWTCRSKTVFQEINFNNRHC